MKFEIELPLDEAEPLRDFLDTANTAVRQKLGTFDMMDTSEAAKMTLKIAVALTKTVTQISQQLTTQHAPVKKFHPNEADKDMRERLRDICVHIEERLPEKYGFICMAVPFGEGGLLRYTANIDRTSAINTLKEFLLSCGAAEDWMKDIK